MYLYNYNIILNIYIYTYRSPRGVTKDFPGIEKDHRGFMMDFFKFAQDYRHVTGSKISLSNPDNI